MVRTLSTMLDLGTPAPGFALPDVTTGETITLETFHDRAGLLVIFWCRHCPFVKHVEQELAQIGRDYAGTDAASLGIVAISSNDAVNYPDDSPASLAEMAIDLGLNFPSCYDETQAIAQAYTAACTPDFFLFNRDLKLVYRGQLDDSRPGNDVPVTGRDLRAAIEALLSGTAIDPNQRPSIGCNIKWREGNAPDYFG